MSDEAKPEIMRWFESDHLKDERTRELVGHFAAAADAVLTYTTPGAEQDTSLRKLLEAKDAAVRAHLLDSGVARQPSALGRQEAALAGNQDPHWTEARQGTGKDVGGLDL